MSRSFIVFVLVLLMAGTCLSGSRCAAQTPFMALDQPMDFQAKRVSSSDTNDWVDGNGDARPIEPGQTLTMAEMEGPGRIVHIWFTVASPVLWHGRALVLRMYWDGEEQPAVEAPLGDFFAMGHGVRENLTSFPVAISSDGRSYNCYWPMPFRKSARITVTNESEHRMGIYYYFDWQQTDSLAEDTPYFHAQYRQEYPCQPGDYLILDTTGTGHYVGTVLSVQHRENGWFGEGDDRFYVDGEDVPSIQGTGTEDYFCDAWGFRQLNRPFYGISLWEGDRKGDRGTAYRWHIHDPVTFQKSLKLVIEHKGPRWKKNSDPLEISTMYAEREDDYSSVAFWYQTGQAARYAKLPPLSERLSLGARWEGEKAFPADNLPANSMIQELPHATSENHQIYFFPFEATATLQVPFKVEEQGEYLIAVGMYKSIDYGIYDILIDDKIALSRIDFYANQPYPKEYRLGVHKLDKGEHILTFRCQGANQNSRRMDNQGVGYFLGFDYIDVIPF